MKFHHIGFAVKSIAMTTPFYVSAGYEQSAIVFDPCQNVNICWLKKSGMPLVELLEPINETSPITIFIKKNGVSPYHICYEVDNLEQSISLLREMKYVIVCKPVPAVAIHNCNIAFMYNRNVGLIELVESPANI